MRINKEKSIAWGRLMYRLNFFTVLDILMDYFFWAMGMAGGLVFYFMGLQNTVFSRPSWNSFLAPFCSTWVAAPTCLASW